MHVNRHRLSNGPAQDTGFPRASANHAAASQLPCRSSLSNPVSQRSLAMTNMKNLDKRACCRWRTLWLIAPTIFTMTACTRSTKAAPPSIEVPVADVEQKDVPIYGQWI